MYTIRRCDLIGHMPHIYHLEEQTQVCIQRIHFCQNQLCNISNSLLPDNWTKFYTIQYLFQQYPLQGIKNHTWDLQDVLHNLYKFETLQMVSSVSMEIPICWGTNYCLCPYDHVFRNSQCTHVWVYNRYILGHNTHISLCLGLKRNYEQSAHTCAHTC